MSEIDIVNSLAIRGYTYEKTIEYRCILSNKIIYEQRYAIYESVFIEESNNSYTEKWLFGSIKTLEDAKAIAEKIQKTNPDRYRKIVILNEN